MYVASDSFIIDGQKIAATSESNWFDFFNQIFQMLWKHAVEPPALGELSHKLYWGCYCWHSSSSLQFRVEKNEAWRRQEKQQVKWNNNNKNSMKQLIREDSTRTVCAVTNHIRTWEKNSYSSLAPRSRLSTDEFYAICGMKMKML